MTSYLRYHAKDVHGITKTIAHLQWNGDGKLLSAITNDKTVRILQLDNNNALQVVQTIPTTSQMAQVCWRPDNFNQFALIGDDYKPVDIWDTRASKPSQKLTSLGGNINMAWSPSGHYIAIGNKSDYLSVFDVRNGALVKKKKIPYELNELSWTANSDHIVAAISDDHTGGATLVNFTNDELREVNTTLAHCASCYYLETDRRQRVMALGSQDYCVSLWDLHSFTCLQTLPIDADIKGLSFSGDGEYLVIIPEDPSLLICNVSSGEPVSRIVTKQKAGHVSWHPTHSLLALAVEDRGSAPLPLKLMSFPQS